MSTDASVLPELRGSLGSFSVAGSGRPAFSVSADGAGAASATEGVGAGFVASAVGVAGAAEGDAEGVTEGSGEAGPEAGAGPTVAGAAPVAPFAASAAG